MIHGNRVSIGCLAMGDEVAEELFVLAVDAGWSEAKVIVSPVDFRDAVLPSAALRFEPWVKGLYADIRERMIALPSRLATVEPSGTGEWNLSVREAGGLTAFAWRDERGSDCAIADMERALETWRDAGPSKYDPPPCVSVEPSIDGLWARSSIMEESSRLQLTFNEDGESHATYQSWGHLAEYTFDRRATYSNGELRLDGPVAPYIAKKYFQLFSVRLGGALYLVPGPVARYVEAAASATACDNIDTHAFGGNIFRRVSEAK